MSRNESMTVAAASAIFLLGASAAVPAQPVSSKGMAPAMLIVRNGSQPSLKGPAATFVGAVRVDPLLAARDPSRISVASVTFEPGARSAWHTHPAGQILVATAGLGWVQQEGGPVEEIRNGDVVWTPPGVKHWHGASATTALTHLAIQEAVAGRAVDWLEPVSDAQYRRPTP